MDVTTSTAPTTSPSTAPALALLREAFRRQAAPAPARDVARELPGFPATGLAGFTISLLAADPRHLA